MLSVSCQTPSSARRQKLLAGFSIGMNGRNFIDEEFMFFLTDSSQIYQVRRVDGLAYRVQMEVNQFENE